MDLSAIRTLSIVIPVYNEARTISHVIDAVRNVQVHGLRKELIIVDDGSTDGTWAALEQERAASDVLVMHQPVNRGKGAAVRAALACVTGELVIIQDADLELTPEEYPGLVAPFLEDPSIHVVFGSRFLAGRRAGQPLAVMANWLLTNVTNVLFGSQLTDMGTCYKLCRVELLRSLALESDGFEIDSEITAKLLRCGFAIRELPIAYQPRTRDEGKTITWFDGLRALVKLIEWRVRPIAAPRPNFTADGSR